MNKLTIGKGRNRVSVEVGISQRLEAAHFIKSILWPDQFSYPRV